jgi:nicotinamide-nucleotide amidase
LESELFKLAEQLGRLLNAQGKIIATAESCTGGSIAQVITEVPGSSAWYDRGFVTYSNASKMQMLGVSSKTLEVYGAVSADTAIAMAEGALARSDADIVVAVTGIAGPDGGTLDKPVGTVFIAWAERNGEVQVVKKYWAGSRRHIRAQTVKAALEGIWILY